jgi:hypothetical protein
MKIMKNLLLSILIISGLAACKSDPKLDSANRDIQLLTDSTVYNNNTFSDTAATAHVEKAPLKITEPPHAVVRTKKSISSKNTVVAPVYSQPSIAPVATTPPVETAPVPQTATVGTNTETGADSNSGTVATTPQVEKKKGWSKAAQGAAIGGVSGAVGGAILSKKKGLGAVVGGVIGAAGGYIIGKGMDKKDNQFVVK